MSKATNHPGAAGCLSLQEMKDLVTEALQNNCQMAYSTIDSDKRADLRLDSGEVMLEPQLFIRFGESQFFVKTTEGISRVESDVKHVSRWVRIFEKPSELNSRVWMEVPASRTEKVLEAIYAVDFDAEKLWVKAHGG